MNFYVDKIQKFFSSVAKYFSDSGHAFSWLFIIFIGLFLLTTVVVIISSAFSYEFVLTRAIDKINKYLSKNPKINEDNLIPFNNKMKEGDIPKVLRRQWQQFMLYREHEASYYMSFKHCVENPLKNSTYNQQIHVYKIVSFVLIFISLLVGIFCSYQTTFTGIMQDVLIIPIFILVFYWIISMILNLIHNATTGDLYQNYQYFEINMDKATVSLPEYVDYEVLFTQQEIKRGIPVLFEYIQKRAIEEQKELERARIRNVEHEKYNFDPSGLDAALVLERSMQEAENYIATRKKYMQDIEQVNNEISATENQYKENIKENQKLMQTSKETVDGLKRQLEQATSSIEINYIKKQMKDEINRQQIAERDFDTLTEKYNKEVKSMQNNINTIQDEIEKSKKALEVSMMSEFSTYSGKVYKKIESAVKNDEKSIINNYKKQIGELEEKLSSKDEELDNIYSQYQTQLSQLEEKSKQFDNILQEKDDIISQVQDQLEEGKSKKSKNTKYKQNVETDLVPDNNFDDIDNGENGDGALLFNNSDEEEVEPFDAQPLDENAETDNNDFDFNSDSEPVDNGEIVGLNPNEEDEFNFGNYTEDFGDSLNESNDIEKRNNNFDALPENNDESVGEFGDFNYLPDEGSINRFNDKVANDEPEVKVDDESDSQEMNSDTFDYLPKPLNPTNVEENSSISTDKKDEDDGGDESFNYLPTNSGNGEVDGKKAKEEKKQAEKDADSESKKSTDESDDDDDFFKWLNDDKVKDEDEDEDEGNDSDALKVEKEDVEETEVEKEDEEKTEDDSEDEEFDFTPKPKGRPGRPRKVVDEDEDDKPKGRPGRPRKVVDEDNQPIRRPGRPRKVVDEDDEPKRKPGRPKKADDGEERPVGRPRKATVGRPKGSTAKRPGRPAGSRSGAGRPKGTTKKRVGRPKGTTNKRVGRPKGTTNKRVGRPKTTYTKKSSVGRPKKKNPVGRPKKN